MKIEVGKRFEGDFLPDSEGPVLDFTRERFNLVIKLKGVSPKEVETFSTSRQIRFALFLPPEVAILLIEIPGLLEWADAPYSVATLKPEHWPDAGAGQVRALKLNLVLVEAKNHQVLAVRHVEFSEDFSAEFLTHVESMKQSPPSAAEFIKKVMAVQAKTSTRQMIQKAVAFFPETAPQADH